MNPQPPSSAQPFAGQPAFGPQPAPPASAVPPAIDVLSTRDGYDRWAEIYDGEDNALIALGCVIRGATPHFDYVAGEASRGVANLSLAHDIPIGFGILTVDTVEQAVERAGTKGGNKGADAALAAIQMATALRQMEQ